MSNEKLKLYKSYLINLTKYNDYILFLNNENKKDNNTNIKLFFFNYIFISIIDYKNKNYLLHSNNRDLIRYIRKNPEKKMNRKQSKKEKLNIFLKELKNL